jgi:hypothetical protein
VKLGEFVGKAQNSSEESLQQTIHEMSPATVYAPNLTSNANWPIALIF